MTKQGKQVKAVKGITAWADIRNGRIDPQLIGPTRDWARAGFGVPLKVLIRPAPKRVLYEAEADNDSLVLTMQRAEEAAREVWRHAKRIRVIVEEL